MKQFTFDCWTRYLTHFESGFIVNYFIDYLTITELLCLDNAHTNHTLRPYYLQILHFLFHRDTSTLRANDIGLQWLFKRGLMIKRIDSTTTFANIDIINQFSSTINNISIFDCSSFTDSVLNNILQNYTRLRDIRIKRCLSLSTSAYSALFNHIEHLDSLTLEFPMLSRVDHITLNILIDGSITYNNLLSLHLLQVNLTDNFIAQLLHYTPNLKSIDISYNQELTDNSLYTISKYCTSLITLCTIGVSLITNVGVISILNSCVYLTSLSVDPHAMMYTPCLDGKYGCVLSSSTLALQSLSIFPNSNPQHYDPSSTSYHPSFLDELCLCIPKLATLFLSSSSVTNAAVVTSLFTHCNVLVEVDLSVCRVVDDDVIIALAYSCPKLTSLDISSCPLVTDRSIEILAAQCLCLSILHMNNMSNNSLTSRSFTAISSINNRTSPLLGLHTSNNGHISDLDIELLCSNNHKIQKLDLSKCILLTNTSLYSIAKHCRDIQHLNLEGIPGLSNRGIVALTTRLTRLTDLKVPKRCDTFALYMCMSDVCHVVSMMSYFSMILWVSIPLLILVHVCTYIILCIVILTLVRRLHLSYIHMLDTV